MSRYHINPKTGNPGICRAKIKCRFGDMETEHYGSKDEARDAYEKKQKANKLGSIYTFTKNKPYKDDVNKRLNVFHLDDNAPIDANREKFVKFLKDSGVNNFKVGKITRANEQQLADIKVYQNIANDLIIKNFTQVEEKNGKKVTVFSPPRSYVMGYDDPRNHHIGNGFSTIGSGVTNNAYLHEESGMIFKVPNDWSKKNGYDDGEGNIRDNLVIKEQYEKLNGERLSEDYNIDYAKTYFLNVSVNDGESIPVQVQEYLPPEEYQEVRLEPVMERALLKKYGETLGDFHDGNVRRHRETGRIVLIDCIMAWDSDSGDPW